MKKDNNVERVSKKKRMQRIISVVIACFLAGTMVIGTIVMFFGA